MSSPVTTFQTLGMTAQTAVSAAVSVTDVPEQLQSQPTGTVLPAVITPPRVPTELPIITVTLPDGTEMAFPAKLPHVPGVETPVSLKILPPEVKNVLSFRLHFSAPLPDIKEAARALEAALKTQSAVIESPVKPISVQAFVLKSVPEQIAALLPEPEKSEPLPRLNIDGKINIELTPDQNALPALTRRDIAAAPPGIQATPMPQAPADEIIKVIEMPKEIPDTEQMPRPPLPAAAGFAETPKAGNSSVFMAQTTAALPADLPENFSFDAQKNPSLPSFLQTPKSVVVPDFAPTGKTENQPGTSDIKDNASPVFLKTPQNPFVREEKAVLAASQKDPSSAPFPVRQSFEAQQNASAPPNFSPVRQDSSPASAATMLQGTVFLPQEDQIPLIITKIGVLAVEEKIHLPHLTPVHVKVLSLPVENESPIMPKTPLPEFKNTWTVLTDALETLRQTDQTAFEAVKNILPHVGNRLPALMLSFMNAAAQNVSFSSFIGEANVSALRATPKGERLLKQLEKEFSASPKKATDGQNSWNGWDIPFLSGSVVEPVSLYLQRPSDGDLQRGSVEKQRRNVRFVLDLNLTKLGKIQMEGLACRSERRFDLILRHQNDFPAFFDNTIQNIFTQTLSALNYTGLVKVDRTNDFILFAPDQGGNIKRGVLV